MRKVAASLFCVAFASSAFAGTVTFTPQQQDVLPGEAAVMDVSVGSSTFAQYDTVFMVIGSDDGLPLNFQYAQSFSDLTTLDEAPPSSFGIFPSDVAFGGNRFASPAFVSPLLVGRLTIDTTGLAEGTYDVFVSSSAEEGVIGSALSGLGFGTQPLENLEGRGSFTVVPEPATLMLLGLGGLAAAFRRRIV